MLYFYLMIVLPICTSSSASNVTQKLESREQTELKSEVIYLTRSNSVAYLQSPNYPDGLYPPNIQKQYHVEVRLPDAVALETARIIVQFEIFLLEQSVFCYKDGLDIADQKGQIRVYCGPQAGRTFISQENVLRFRMFTDGDTEDRGFRIKVQLYESPCTKTLYASQSGVITSPNYPYRYGSEDLCLWKIIAPQGMVVRMKFNGRFDIKSENDVCLRDHLEVSKTGSFETDSKRYCGNLRPTAIESQGNTMLVKFFSDCCEHGYGVKMEYAAVYPNTVTQRPVTTPRSCDCGRANDQLRIVGGNEAPDHKYPWQVALVNEDEFYFAGGSLISSWHVLTAAHCCYNRKTESIRVVLGAHNLPNAHPSIGVRSCVMHPKFDRATLDNDVAVLTLEQPVAYDDFVRPVCLPRDDSNSYTGNTGSVTGWGRVRNGGETSENLKEAKVPVVSNGECTQKYGALITDRTLCAGGEQNDACQGDSGGPLQLQEGASWTQIGIVSSGIGCGRPGYPGLYSRVSKHLPFIMSVTGNSVCAAP